MVLERQSRAGSSQPQQCSPIRSMKLNSWFTRSNKLMPPLRLAMAGALVLAAVALAVTSTKMSTPLLQAAKPRHAPKKMDADSFKPGVNAETTVMEGKNPDSSPEIEAYLLRAFPATEIPGDATLKAKADWSALNASAHGAGTWQLIGPSKATYPAVLDPFLFDGAPYVAS